jgi:acyl-CoA synthetase (AMP-forming)/AMP-acid ligase II
VALVCAGSTALPKGVMISHGNLSHNLSTIVRSLVADDSTQVVSWLPQYHDMGLIGSYLGVVWCGGSGVYLSPISFVKNPPMWIHVGYATSP